MKKIALLSFVFFLIFSCQKKEEKATCTPEKSDKDKKFEMYSMSEMAALMEQMYVENKRVKDKIMNGESIGEFPEYYLKIHSSKFTDESENDAFFKEYATLYIETQKDLYSDKEDIKKKYNLGIDACISCHESKCGGPIPKIKKLYIK